ncbi:hypothetical protein ACFY2M_35220 [Streptomyces sp. NPDC001276]|uniref:hypothetical protein n=1 Tax=Streptomyces sp. NPDC001276 TaxID=3364555 RepID=UPI0036B25620
MPEELVAFGVPDGGEPFSQTALIEKDLTVDAWQDAAVHQQVAQVGRSVPSRAVTSGCQ